MVSIVAYAAIPTSAAFAMTTAISMSAAIAMSTPAPALTIAIAIHDDDLEKSHGSKLTRDCPANN